MQIQFCAIMEELKVNEKTIKASVKTKKTKSIEKSTIDADRFGIVEKFYQIETIIDSYLFDLDSLDSESKEAVLSFLNKELNPIYAYTINGNFGFDVQKEHRSEISLNFRSLKNGDLISFATEIDSSKSNKINYCANSNIFYYIVLD